MRLAKVLLNSTHNMFSSRIRKKKKIPLFSKAKEIYLKISIKMIKCHIYPLCSKVSMLNPKVGDIVSMSSPLNFFKIVVFPALSNPLYSLRKTNAKNS